MRQLILALSISLFVNLSAQGLQLRQDVYGIWHGGGRTWGELTHTPNEAIFYDEKGLIDERESSGIVGIILLIQNNQTMQYHVDNYGFKIASSPIKWAVIGSLDQKESNPLWKDIRKNSPESRAYILVANSLSLPIPNELVAPPTEDEKYGMTNQVEKLAWISCYAEVISQLSIVEWQRDEFYKNSSNKNFNFKQAGIVNTAFDDKQKEYQVQYQNAVKGKMFPSMKQAMHLQSIQKALYDEIVVMFTGSVDNKTHPGAWAGYSITMKDPKKRKEAINGILSIAKTRIEKEW